MVLDGTPGDGSTTRRKVDGDRNRRRVDTLLDVDGTGGTSGRDHSPVSVVDRTPSDDLDLK